MSWGIGSIIAATIAALILLGGLSFVLNWTDEAGQVAYEQTGPRAILIKYETFKDTAADLDSKWALIKGYDSQLKQTKKDYGADMSKWSDAAINHYNNNENAKLGQIGLYNRQSAEYNANMAKVNYYWANVGNLPQGGEPVPREYRTYIDNVNLTELKSW